MKADVHELVRQAYTKALTRAKGGCCRGAPETVLAELAGYTPAELSGVPADAALNSFGCGNPLAFSEVEPGQIVLDLGSGAGIDLLIAARKVGPAGTVIGVDMTDAMIQRARRNIAEAGAANVKIRRGLIEALPVDAASVDWVISNCVINLSPDKPRVFAEIFRVLRPGGRMRVADIVVENLSPQQRQSVALYASCIAGAISEREYVAGLQAAGLVDVKVRHRLTYDQAQLCAIAPSALPPHLPTAEIARQLAGKVHSAVFFARKPQAMR